MLYLDEISKNIVMLRHAQGLTQEETAYRANISVKCLQKVESGKQNSTVDTISRIAASLGVNSRVLAIFNWPDAVILSELSNAPHLPKQAGGTLQICENISLLRKAKGFTQLQLARQASISDSYLRNIEQACANVTLLTLLSIANAFGTSLLRLDACSVPTDIFMDWVFQARDRAGIR